MKRVRKSPDVPLLQIKFKDLVRTDSDIEERRLVNLKVPADMLTRVHSLALKLGVTKTAAIVALLNEGLDLAHTRGVGIQN